MIILCFPILAFTEIAPFFPLVSHSFVLNPIQSDDLSFVFNSKSLEKSKRPGLSIAHQNREWDYNWFVVASVVPTQIGHFGIGYSNYGYSSLPVTNSDALGTYIEGNTSDTFETLVIAFSPAIKEVDFTISTSYKYRRLVDQSANALHVDFKLSSPYIVNNQLGIQTKNLLGTKYSWDTTTRLEEDLPQYIGVYYIQPIHTLTLMLENDVCLNYSSLTTQSAGLSFQLDSFIRLFFSYQSSTIQTATTLGSEIALSEVFNLKYANRNESNDQQELSIHSIGIGVKF
ncbi:MAG: hypothetical protein VW397_02050 [Candidatus Margulisiibacteriota bacterium]